MPDDFEWDVPEPQKPKFEWDVPEPGKEETPIGKVKFQDLSPDRQEQLMKHIYGGQPVATVEDLDRASERDKQYNLNLQRLGPAANAQYEKLTKTGTIPEQYGLDVARKTLPFGIADRVYQARLEESHKRFLQGEPTDRDLEILGEDQARRRIAGERGLLGKTLDVATGLPLAATEFGYGGMAGLGVGSLAGLGQRGMQAADVAGQIAGVTSGHAGVAAAFGQAEPQQIASEAVSNTLMSLLGPLSPAKNGGYAARTLAGTAKGVGAIQGSQEANYLLGLTPQGSDVRRAIQGEPGALSDLGAQVLGFGAFEAGLNARRPQPIVERINAEGIRENARQVQEPGDVRPGGEAEGRPDLQRQPQPVPAPGDTQTGQEVREGLSASERSFGESLAKKYGAPVSPSVPAVEPGESVSRFTNMLERAADKSANPAELNEILLAAKGKPEESRIAWAVANNPNASLETFAQAKSNPALRSMTSDENIARLDSRRAELQKQTVLSGDTQGAQEVKPPTAGWRAAAQRGFDLPVEVAKPAETATVAPEVPPAPQSPREVANVLEGQMREAQARLVKAKANEIREQSSASVGIANNMKAAVQERRIAAKAVESLKKQVDDARVKAAEADANAPSTKTVIGELMKDDAGAISMSRIKELGEAGLEKAKSVGHFVADAFGKLGGKMYPQTTRINRPIGEALGQLVTSRRYAEYASEALADKILGRGSKPEFDNLVGAVENEMRFRYMRNAFTKAGRPQDAAKVGTMIGSQHLPDEAAFQTALKDPEVNRALDAYEKEYLPIKDTNFRGSQGLGQNDPIDSLTQIPGHAWSLKTPFENEKPGQNVAVLNPSGYRNLKLRKLGSSYAASGSADAYLTDFREIIRRDLMEGDYNARKAELYRTTESQGKGEWAKPGSQQEGRVEIPFADPPPGTQEATRGDRFYVDKDIATDFERAIVSKDAPWVEVSGKIMKPATIASLAGISEFQYHGFNLGSIPFVRSSGGAWHGGLLDIANAAYKRITDFQGSREKLMEAARLGYSLGHTMESGAILPKSMAKYDPTYYMGKVLGILRDVNMLAAKDGFDRMVKKGWVEDTITNRRDFYNQTGQYEHKAQNSLISLFRKAGLGPFATAGSQMTATGVRALALSPGVPATSYRAALLMRAELLAKFSALFGTSMAYNYAKWGRVDGDDDTPLMAFKTGTNEKGQTTYFDPPWAKLLRRGAKAVGVNAIVEGMRKDQTGGEVVDQAVKEAKNSVVHPFMGPGPAFVRTALTGENAIGLPIADRAKKGESQFRNNFMAALYSANPLVGILSGYDRMQKEREATSIQDRLDKLWGPFGPRPTYKKRH